MLDANAATMIRPVALVKISSNASIDLELRAGEAAAIDVGAVGEQRQHAARAELGEAVQVEMLAVDRRLVDLEVARMDQRPDRRVDRQRHAVGHAVRHADEFDLERTDRHALARPHRHEPVRAVEAVLPQFGLDERERQRRGVHGTVDVAAARAERAPM